MMFGAKVENLLNEFHPKTGKPVHKLENLLKKPSEPIADKPVTKIARNSSMISPKPTRKRKQSAQETT